MKHSAALMMVLLPACAMAHAADAPWLSIFKSKTGYLFQGRVAQGPFSFDVPGVAIQTSQNGGRAIASIDGVVLQMFYTPSNGKPDAASLDAFAAGEQARVARAQGKIAPSNACSSPLPHREWKATLPNGAVTIFVESLLHDRIFVLDVGTQAPRAAQAEAMLRAACASFKS